MFLQDDLTLDGGAVYMDIQQVHLDSYQIGRIRQKAGGSDLIKSKALVSLGGD